MGKLGGSLVSGECLSVNCVTDTFPASEILQRISIIRIGIFRKIESENCGHTFSLKPLNLLHNYINKLPNMFQRIQSDIKNGYRTRRNQRGGVLRLLLASEMYLKNGGQNQTKRREEKRRKYSTPRVPRQTIAGVWGQ